MIIFLLKYYSYFTLSEKPVKHKPKHFGKDHRNVYWLRQRH